LNDTEQITRYLAGDLNSGELKAFEERLQSDPDFAETVKLFRSVEKEMQVTPDELEIREKLKPLSQQYFGIRNDTPVMTMPRKRVNWWLYGSAAAACLLVLLWLRPWQQKTYTSNELYAQYAQSEPLPVMVRGANQDSLQIRAAELFNRKDYAAALPLLSILVQNNPGEAQLQLSLGICFAETGVYDTAVTRFDSLASGPSIYKYDALFWKALVYLKQDNKDACRSVLKQIPADANNEKTVKKLLSELGE